MVIVCVGGGAVKEKPTGQKVRREKHIELEGDRIKQVQHVKGGGGLPKLQDSNI